MTENSFVNLKKLINVPINTETFIQVIKSRMRWVGHIAWMRAGRGA
jgi:hypothetical protein